MNEILKALPKHFDFYHLGEIQLTPDSPLPSTPLKDQKADHYIENKQAIGYRIFGDRKVLFVLLIPEGLDLSTYSEFGNLLVSKITNQIQQESMLDLYISPPFSIHISRLTQILHTNQAIKKTYLHSYGNSVIPIETLILPSIESNLNGGDQLC